MYDVKPNLLIGFHGCEKATRDFLLSNPDKIRISEKPYDWLGHGFYFWENNLERAWMWAQEKKRRGLIKEPAVIGGIINLGNCCDLIDSKHINFLNAYYETLVIENQKNNAPLPRNRDLPGDQHQDKVLRELDCTVIEFMHEKIWEQQLTGNNLKPFDTVRGAFFEGGPAFEGSGFKEKTHIQICVRNLNKIKAFFLPRSENNFKDWEDEKYTYFQNKSLLN